MKIYLLIILSAFSFSNAFAQTESAESSDKVCAQCTKINLITADLANLTSYDEKKATPLIIKATAAVKALPVLKGGKLTPAQVLAVSRLLAAAYKFDNDPDYSIIDGNLKLFQRNQKLFYKTFDTFGKADAEKLRDGLDVKLGEAEHGQDSKGAVDPDSIEPIVKPKKK